MTRPNAFLADQRAATAAEFALVLPLMLLFLIGIMDVGLYAWSINRGEKATQVGARWAVATDIVASGLGSYKFATDGGVPQGTIVPQEKVPNVTCTAAGCTCASACSFGNAYDGTAFTNIVTQMQRIKADVQPEDVEIVYSWSGLGFAGDPNGPDVAPIVTVRLVDTEFQPLSFLLFDGQVGLPDFAYSLTTEDSEGEFAYY